MIRAVMRDEVDADIETRVHHTTIAVLMISFLVACTTIVWPVVGVGAVAVLLAVAAFALRPVYRVVWTPVVIAGSRPGAGPGAGDGVREFARAAVADYDARRRDLLTTARAMHPDDLAACLAHADEVRAAREAADRQTRISAYEAHISDPDWRSKPAVEWMRREAELRAALPADYPLPKGVGR